MTSNTDYPFGQTLKRIFRRRYDSFRRVLFEAKGRLRAHLGPHLALRQHEPRPWTMRDDIRDAQVPYPAPSISIVTPTLNQARFLEQTIESIAQQRYPCVEHIVQDGASTDGTLAILDRWKDSLHSYESTGDTGQANAINRGFRRATGDILAYINSDDIVLPGALSYVASYFVQHPDTDVVYSHRVIIDRDNDEIGRWILPRHDPEVLSWADYVPQETMFWRRRIWECAGASLDESFDFAMDWDLLLRFRDAGARIVRVPRFLSAFRVHCAQKSSASLELGRREMARIRERIHQREVPVDEVHSALRTFRIKQSLYHQLYRLMGRDA